MKKSILFSIIVLMMSCTTSSKITHIGSIHKIDKSQDQLTQVKLVRQPVFLFKKEIKDTVSGRKMYKKLPQDLKAQYDSIMLHTEEYQIELGEEYRIVKQLNSEKNRKMLAFLYKNLPVQMITKIYYLLPKYDQDKINMNKEYFLNTNPNQSEKEKLFSGNDTIILNPEHVLAIDKEYVCIVQSRGKYKVISLEEKRRECPKEKDKINKYKFN